MPKSTGTLTTNSDAPRHRSRIIIADGRPIGLEKRRLLKRIFGVIKMFMKVFKVFCTGTKTEHESTTQNAYEKHPIHGMVYVNTESY